jgi:polysaccharide pyruvyl transferase WcaK-like protein
MQKLGDATVRLVTKGRERDMRIGFFGHFGSRNLGNEATLVAILSRLRALDPSSEFCCICSHPEIARARYGIDAVPVTIRSIRIWNRQAPLRKRLGMALAGAREELGDYAHAFKALKRTDTLIIPGTGLLTDAYGFSAWRPYGLFKWLLMAKLRRCKVLFVSVGAGPVHTVLGRLLIKTALSLADYRSYRDDASREYLKQIGFRTRRDPVYPDLTFSLPQELLGRETDLANARPVVGVGLMEHAGRYGVADPSDETYAAYLESLVIFVRRLLERGYDIKLILGDGDTFVVDDFRSLLRERSGSCDEGRVTYAPAETFSDLLAQLEVTDAVVATRFHNILFAILLDKPVVAVTFHHKCTSLMRDMGLARFCHDISDMNPERLIAQFEELMQSAEDVTQVSARRVNAARAMLDEQYEILFDAAEGAARAGSASTVPT